MALDKLTAWIKGNPVTGFITGMILGEMIDPISRLREWIGGFR